MRLIATISLLSLPVVAAAHHSRAEFSDETIELRGEIVEVAWRNPHPLISVRTVENGEEKVWRVESWSSANSLDRKGVPSDSLEIGQQVMVAGRPSTRRPDIFLGTHIRLADGSEAVLQPGNEPFWGGQALAADDATPGGSASGAVQGIFRVWTYEERSVTPEDLPLTAAAQTLLESFDEMRDHPQYSCEAEGMPLVMDSVYPIQFVDQGDEILLRLERTDATRTIHMNADPDANPPGTLLGYSVGRWDGNDLVITTRNVDYPFFNDDGVQQTDSVEFAERFSLSADGQTLEWEAVVSDPTTFTGPVTINTSWTWVPGESIKQWNCAVTE